MSIRVESPGASLAEFQTIMEKQHICCETCRFSEESIASDCCWPCRFSGDAPIGENEYPNWQPKAHP